MTWRLIDAFVALGIAGACIACESPSLEPVDRASLSASAPAPALGPKRWLVRVIRCGYFEGSVGDVTRRVDRKMGVSGSMATGTTARTPGSWWCALATKRYEGTVPNEPLVVLEVASLVVGEERRRAMPDPVDAPAEPGGVSGTASVFFGHPKLESSLVAITDRFRGGDPKNIEALCMEAATITAEPLTLQARVAAFQKRFLEEGAFDHDDTSLIESRMETLRLKCAATP